MSDALFHIDDPVCRVSEDGCRQLVCQRSRRSGGISTERRQWRINHLSSSCCGEDRGLLAPLEDPRRPYLPSALLGQQKRTQLNLTERFFVVVFSASINIFICWKHKSVHMSAEINILVAVGYTKDHVKVLCKI